MECVNTGFLLQTVGLSVTQAVIWSWYAATTGNRPDAAWFLVGLVVVAMYVGLVRLLWWTKKKQNGPRNQQIRRFMFLVVLFVLWTTCVTFGIARIDNDKITAENVVLVLTDKTVYWLAMTCAVLVLCAVPAAANVYVQTKVARARQVALAIAWCVLDVYTLYLLHEVTTIVYKTNTDFGERWRQSTSIPENSTIACDQEDEELKTYGLLYQNQVSPLESQRFTCAFELHKAIRLNFLCAVVAWTIYRISTHGKKGAKLLVTAMVFLALSTTVDDLRSYWVLGLEQAAFLSGATALDFASHLPVQNNNKVLEEPSGEKNPTGDKQSVGATVENPQGDELQPFITPGSGAQPAMVLDF